MTGNMTSSKCSTNLMIIHCRPFLRSPGLGLDVARGAKPLWLLVVYYSRTKQTKSSLTEFVSMTFLVR